MVKQKRGVLEKYLNRVWKSFYKILKYGFIILIILIFMGYFFAYKPIREYYNEVGILEEKMSNLISEFNFAKSSLNYDKAYDIYLDYVNTLSEYSFKIQNPPISIIILIEEFGKTNWDQEFIMGINQRIDTQNQMREILVSLRVFGVVS